MMKTILLLLSLSLVGCSHLKTYPPTGLTLADFWKEQLGRYQELTVLSAKLRLAYSGRQGSVSGQGRMVLQDRSRIRLEVRDPFGRVHYLVVVDGDNFLAYYPRQKLAYVDGQSGAAYVEDFLGLDFSFVDLQSVLLGVLPARVKKEDMREWRWHGELNQYEGVIRMGDEQVSCFVDSQRGNLRSLRLKSPSREVEIEYSDFAPCCDGRDSSIPLSVARVVQVNLKKSSMSLQVEWEQLRILEAPRPQSTFEVKLGSDVKKIFLE